MDIVCIDIRPNDTTLQIWTLVDKRCGLDTNKLNVNSKWLASKYTTKFRDDQNQSARSFIATVQSKYFTKISRWQFYKAKTRARVGMEGNAVDQYARI